MAKEYTKTTLFFHRDIYLDSSTLSETDIQVLISNGGQYDQVKKTYYIPAEYHLNKVLIKFLVTNSDIRRYLGPIFYLIPEDQKEKAEKAGAVWDNSQSAYLYNSEDSKNEEINPFLQKWEIITPYIIFLDVPYEEKDVAKSLGARWEPPYKMWYIASNMDQQPFARWLL